MRDALPSEPPGLPRLRLANFPTPLVTAPRLGAAIGCPGLLVKREDESGLGMGGNKPRQLEVILADAAAKGCDTIVTAAATRKTRTMAIRSARTMASMSPPWVDSSNVPSTALNRWIGTATETISSPRWDTRTTLAGEPARAASTSG